MSRPLIQSGFANSLSLGVRRRGMDVARIYSLVGIDARRVGQPDYLLTQAQFSNLLRQLVHVSGDELFGLGNDTLRRGTFRTLCELLIQSPTLEHAIGAGSRLLRIVTRDFVIRFEVKGAVARLWMISRISDDEQRRPLTGVVIFFIYGLMCWLTGGRIPLDAVQFDFSARAYTAGVAGVYRAPVNYDSTTSGFSFDSRWLTLPPVPDERRLRRFIDSLPANIIFGFRDHLSFTERVQVVLRRNLADSPTLKDVSRALNVSSASLRRRLSEESDSGFQDIKDRVRHRAAVELMQSDRWTLSQIAEQLGFTELSAFHRAFKRWTGVGPGNFRSNL